MLLLTKEKRTSFSFKAGLSLTLIAFLLSIFSGYSPALGANAPAPILPYLPPVGRLVETSPQFDPVSLRGLEFYPYDPFKFAFVLDHASADLSDDELQDNANRLLKYFFAALTIPAKDFWVNLSPYEQDVIVPGQLGATDIGKDLLGEDYMLKQLSASLTCPNSPLGKKFWDEVYRRIKNLYSRSNIPADTFNKVWIIPDKCVVVEDGNRGFIKESRLKVMLEEDYLACRQAGIATQHSSTTTHIAAAQSEQADSARKISVDVMREVILPVIEEEVNHGKNFLYLRQVYNALILATWFKRKLKDSILVQTYADQKKVTGVEGNDPQIKEKIYNQYLESYKQGAYNFIKKEFVRASSGLPVKIMRRKYFSGGFTGQSLPGKLEDQLEKKTGSFPPNVKSLRDPAVLAAVAKPSIMPAARAPARISATLCLFLLAGCVTGIVNPILPQNTTITNFRQDMVIPPGMYTLNDFDNNRPTVIFIHGAGGNPYEFEKFITSYQDKYNIVVFTYKHLAPIQDSANFLTKNYLRLIEMKHPKKIVFINHSYGNNVFAMAVKNDPKKIFAGALVFQLTPTLAGSEMAIGASRWPAQAATSFISAFGANDFSNISAAQDPLGETISALLSAQTGVARILTVVMKNDPHGPNKDSPQIFKDNYQRYVVQNAAVLSPDTDDPHGEPLKRTDVIRAADEVIRSFANGSEDLNTVFKSRLKASVVTDEKKTAAHIGKDGQVKDIAIGADHQGGTADVYAADSGDKLGQIQLQAAGNPLEKTMQKIKEMGTAGSISNQHAGQVILNMFGQIQELGSPDFFTFNELFADVFGFASARPSVNAIALHQALADNPAAISHEVGEYLVQKNLLSFDLTDGVLQVTMAGTATSFALEGEALAIAQKGIQSDGTYNPHYGLRALQRLAFGQKDRDLTETIQNIQEANVKDKATPTRGGIDINLETKLAVETTSKSLSAPKDAAISFDPDILLGVKPLIISIQRLNPHN